MKQKGFKRAVFTMAVAVLLLLAAATHASAGYIKVVPEEQQQMIVKDAVSPESKGSWVQYAFGALGVIGAAVGAEYVRRKGKK